MNKNERDLRQHILDERLTELEQRVSRLEEVYSASMFSPVELYILELFMRGWSVKEIAKQLKRSISSIHGYLRLIHVKLRSGGSRTKLTRAALALGIGLDTIKEKSDE